MKHYVLIVIFILTCFTTTCANNTAITPPNYPSTIEARKVGDSYVNWIDTSMLGGSLLSYFWKAISNDAQVKPEDEIPVISLSNASFKEDPIEHLAFRWLGHSSVLIEMNGYRILIDPVFSEHASPVPIAVKRFSVSPISIEEIPSVDVVVISHDHYDHLDKNTIKAIAVNGTKFFVPLEVGEHLEDWDVSENQIVELSWWEQSSFRDLKMICVPARHFSGRGLFDSDETLWAGWVIQSNTHKIYYSGDTGYANHFKQIGKKLGPFDLTLIKIGAYGDTWPDIHINPKKAIQAHLEVRGRLLLPVHWATFNLALHSWDEPIIKTIQAAKENGVKIVTPIIGELVDTAKPIINKNWWEGIR